MFWKVMLSMQAGSARESVARTVSIECRF